MDSQQDTAVFAPSGEPDEEAVLAYLKAHPDFFIRNAAQITDMTIPHSVKGAVSLVEWQLGRQRERISTLTDDLMQLMIQARENEHLFSRLLKLLASLSAATSLDDFSERLNQWAKGLKLSHARIRLFTDSWRLGAPFRHQDLALSRAHFEAIRLSRFGDRNHYLGQLTAPEIQLLLPDSAFVGSASVSLLGGQHDLGVVIFVSRDKQHYQKDMGTAMLEQVAYFLPQLLQRWVELA